MRFRACGLLVVLLCTLALTAQAEERRFALVIGNGAYVVGGPLKNPVNDARSIEQSLKQVGFRVLRLENSTKLQMERAIRRLSSELTPDTVSVVYYAGHGLQVNGHNYLLPVDAQIDTENSVRLEGVDVDEVLQQMTMAKSRVNIVILDACRNNPFERRFRSVSGGLASIDAPAGTLIAYATSPGKVAADGTGDNGLYTGELIRQIDQPGLSIEAVFKRTRIAVMQRSNGEQTPWESSSLTGDFSFRAAPADTVTAAPAPPLPAKPATAAPRIDQERIELAFWESIKSSRDPADFEDYLKRYPQGDFASLAERRLQALHQPPAQQQPQLPVQPVAVSPPAAAPAKNGDEPDWTRDEKREVERGLKLLGYLRSEPDGTFGPTTRAAIKQYQSFEGAEETGLLSNADRDRLLEATHWLSDLFNQRPASPEGVAATSVKGAEQRYSRGWSFESGRAGRRDPNEAFYWYALAAGEGHSKALTNLGTMLIRGQGTAKTDPAGGALLWMAAAARGEATAMFNLGALYERGVGVAADPGKARRWYERAAALNHPDARAALKRLGS